MPQDAAAEQAVLSAMLISSDILQECIVLLKEADFYQYAHRLIYNAMSDMFANGKVIDSISLADYLKSAGQLDKVGGTSYLIDLNQESTALVSWPHHVEILRRNSTLRDIIAASAKITSLAFDAPGDTKEVVDEAEKLLMGVTERSVRNSYSMLSDVMGELYEELEEACQNPARGRLLHARRRGSGGQRRARAVRAGDDQAHREPQEQVPE